jgi:hypothetical protein
MHFQNSHVLIPRAIPPIRSSDLRPPSVLLGGRQQGHGHTSSALSCSLSHRFSFQSQSS